MELNQGNKTVLQYKANFMELVRFAPHIAGDELRKAKRFQTSLHPNIKDRMVATRLNTFANVVESSMVIKRKCEALLKIRDQGKKRPIQEASKKPAESKQVMNKQTVTVTQQEIPTCARCGKKHCRTYYLDPGACFKCGDMGHMINDCPKMKNTQATKINDGKPRQKV